MSFRAAPVKMFYELSNWTKEPFEALTHNVIGPVPPRDTKETFHYHFVKPEAHNTSWIADRNREGCNISEDDCATGDNCAMADAHATHNIRTIANPNIAANLGAARGSVRTGRVLPA